MQVSKGIDPCKGYQPGRWQSLARCKEGREFKAKGTAGPRISTRRGMDRKALLGHSHRGSDGDSARKANSFTAINCVR